MMKNLLLMLALALTISLTAVAQPTKGSVEMTLSGAGAATKDFDTSNFGLNVGLGYYLTDAVEAGIRQTVNLDNLTGSALTEVALDYNLHIPKLTRVLPYGGLTVGYAYGAKVADALQLGPEVGLKIYVHKNTFVNASIGYVWRFNSPGAFVDNASAGAFRYGVGVGFQF